MTVKENLIKQYNESAMWADYWFDTYTRRRDNGDIKGAESALRIFKEWNKKTLDKLNELTNAR